jgi:hypothetical protein
MHRPKRIDFRDKRWRWLFHHTAFPYVFWFSSLRATSFARALSLTLRLAPTYRCADYPDGIPHAVFNFRTFHPALLSWV